jgi:hypothetical protein
MKNKLTALLLMLSFYGYSQDYLASRVTKSKQDTIPVIMLVCDTSTHGKLLPYEIPNVFWIRGYEVVEDVPVAVHKEAFIIGELPVYRQTIKYLDKNKKQTTLVVWDRRKL